MKRGLLRHCLVGSGVLVCTLASVFGAGESGPTVVLRPSQEPGFANEWFGVDLDLTENLLVVGSSQGLSHEAGTVFVYRRSGTSWVAEQVIAHHGVSVPSGFSANRSFGDDVAISDDEQTIFVGAPSDAGTEYGAVLIYEYQAGSGWTAAGKLVAPDGEALDWFGGTVDASGDNLAVAAYRTNDVGFDSGSVYMFRRQVSGEWIQVDKLTIPDARESDLLGNKLTIEGDLLVVSSVTADLNGNSSQGAVYTFLRNPSDGHWNYMGRLAAHDGSPGDWFGSALAISGDLLAVGANARSVPSRDGFKNQQGSVYLYRRDPGAGSGWKFLCLVKSDDGKAGDWFGRAVAIDGDTMMVGASPWTGVGAVYAFQRNANGIADNWRQVHKFTYPGASGSPHFGDAIVISPHTVVVGARDDRDVAWKDGAAFIYDRGFDTTVPAHHYDTWRATHFSAAALLDAGLRDHRWGDAADPDGDGIPNLAEYFGGMSPLVTDPGSGRPSAAFGEATLSWLMPMSLDPDVRAVAYLQNSDSPEFWERFHGAEVTTADGMLNLAVENYAGHGDAEFFRVSFEED